MKKFFEENGISSIDILHNNCYAYGEYALCGTRGWFYEEEQSGHNEKVQYIIHFPVNIAFAFNAFIFGTGFWLICKGRLES